MNGGPTQADYAAHAAQTAKEIAMEARIIAKTNEQKIEILKKFVDEIYTLFKKVLGEMK